MVLQFRRMNSGHSPTRGAIRHTAYSHDSERRSFASCGRSQRTTSDCSYASDVFIGFGTWNALQRGKGMDVKVPVLFDVPKPWLRGDAWRLNGSAASSMHSPTTSENDHSSLHGNYSSIPIAMAFLGKPAPESSAHEIDDGNQQSYQSVIERPRPVARASRLPSICEGEDFQLENQHPQKKPNLLSFPRLTSRDQSLSDTSDVHPIQTPPRAAQYSTCKEHRMYGRAPSPVSFRTSRDSSNFNSPLMVDGGDVNLSESLNACRLSMDKTSLKNSVPCPDSPTDKLRMTPRITMARTFGKSFKSCISGRSQSS